MDTFLTCCVIISETKGEFGDLDTNKVGVGLWNISPVFWMISPLATANSIVGVGVVYLCVHACVGRKEKQKKSQVNC